MKQSLLTWCVVLSSAAAFSQNQPPAISTLHTFPNSDLAARIDLPYSPAVITEAMRVYKLQSLKSKKNQPAGHDSFQNTALMKNNIDQADLIFKIAQKGPEEDNASVLYLMLKTPNKNDGLPITETIFKTEDGLAYLDNFAVAIRPYALDAQIKLQNKKIERAASKKENLIEKEQKLTEKSTAIEHKNGADKGELKRTEKLEREVATVKYKKDLQEAIIEKNTEDVSILKDKKKELPPAPAKKAKKKEYKY